MRSTAALALIAAGMFLCTASFAQPYPAAPVRIIVPLAPGGGVDAIVRMVAPKLTDSWGQTVTVENHVGAGGTLGTAKVATAPADGLTLLAHSSAHIVSAALRTNLPYDPLKDFVPVAPLTSQAYVMVVGKGSGITTLGQLIAAAKATPGGLKFASAGIGSGTHLMAEKFNKRLNAVPDLPTIADAGLSGFDSTLWYGLWAPAGTPAAVVDRIARDVARALAAQDVRERLAKLGAETMSMTPAEFGPFVRSEAESVARIVGTAGIKPQ